MWCDGCHLFSLENKDAYKIQFDESRTEISDHCLNSRVAWNAGFYYQQQEVEGCLYLISNGGVFTTPHVTFPLGTLTAGKLERIIDGMWPAFEARGWPFRLMYVDAANLALLGQLKGYTASVFYNPDFSDYLYRAEDLRHLRGRAFKQKRNHINRFNRLYPGARFRPLQAQDQEAALALVKNWCDEKAIDCLNLCDSDYRAIRQLFRHMDQLTVYGGALVLGEKLLAFSMGSLVQDHTAVIHFEKADPAYDGAYAVINQQTMAQVFPQALWVNREEDMGVAALRKAKQSYQPHRLIHKYEATLERVPQGA